MSVRGSARERGTRPAGQSCFTSEAYECTACTGRKHREGERGTKVQETMAAPGAQSARRPSTFSPPNSAVALSRAWCVMINAQHLDDYNYTWLSTDYLVSQRLQMGRRQLHRSSRRSNSSTSCCGPCRFRAASAFMCDACCSRLLLPRTFGERLAFMSPGRSVS